VTSVLCQIHKWSYGLHSSQTLKYNLDMEAGLVLLREMPPSHMRWEQVSQWPMKTPGCGTIPAAKLMPESTMQSGGSGRKLAGRSTRPRTRRDPLCDEFLGIFDSPDVAAHVVALHNIERAQRYGEPNLQEGDTLMTVHHQMVGCSGSMST